MKYLFLNELDLCVSECDYLSGRLKLLENRSLRYSMILPLSPELRNKFP